MARMPVSAQEAMKILEAKAAVDTEEIKEHFIVGCEESEIKARGHPSGEKAIVVSRYPMYKFSMVSVWRAVLALHATLHVVRAERTHRRGLHARSVSQYRRSRVAATRNTPS